MYKFENLAEMYKFIAPVLLSKGDIVSPRGFETREFLTPTIHIENPRSRLAYLPRRMFNLPYAFVEAIMLIMPMKEVKYFTPFNPKMADYSDDGVYMHGAYGARIAFSIEKLIDKLKSDYDTRQAVLTIYKSDFAENTRDVPCTLNLHFMIRENKLCLITYMRSNDIIWGTPYDIFMFTMLQEVIATSICIDVGWYRHIPTSLHVYEKHYDLLSEMVDAEPVEFDFNCNYKDYRMFAGFYTASSIVIPNGPNPKTLSEVRLNSITKPISNILLNEKCYRDPSWANQHGIQISEEVPEWSRQFTKRHFKNKPPIHWLD